MVVEPDVTLFDLPDLDEPTNVNTPMSNIHSQESDNAKDTLSAEHNIEARKHTQKQTRKYIKSGLYSYKQNVLSANNVAQSIKLMINRQNDQINLSEKTWFYECPQDDCKLKINSNNIKNLSVDTLLRHVCSVHYFDEFYSYIKRQLPFCPAR